MAYIKKDDVVMVLAGRDRGKSGKVLQVMHEAHKVLVEGVNFVKRHTRKTNQNQQGGIVTKEAPIDISNLAIFCKRCNRGTKTGINILRDGSKARYCKKCNEVF
ncbi:MAG: 50S ribosomal protein L24 [Candidatus Omnitrophica bacterium]|nr:50S ribosomal protein L24 [Candidatus Omnitrophota bacterium]